MTTASREPSIALSSSLSPEGSPSQQHAIAMRARLEGLRDVLLLKNHLAGMDAKDAAHRLSREVGRLSTVMAMRAHDLAAQARDADFMLLAAMFEVNTRLLAMESALKTALAGAARSATAAGETTRMKSSLAAMDAQDAVDARVAEAKRALHQMEDCGAHAVRELDALLTRVGVRASKIV